MPDECTYVADLVRDMLISQSETCLGHAANMSDTQYAAWSKQVAERLTLLVDQVHTQVHVEKTDAGTGNP